VVWIDIDKQLPPLNERILVRAAKVYLTGQCDHFITTIAIFSLERGLWLPEKEEKQYGKILTATHWCHIPDIKLMDDNGTKIL